MPRGTSLRRPPRPRRSTTKIVSAKAAGNGMSKSLKSRLIIGIDYGTAHTSVAYTHIPGGEDPSYLSLGAQLNNILLVTKWPNGLGAAFVPTVTMYDYTRLRDNVPNLPTWWGYRVQRVIDREGAPSTAHAVHLAKLVLHEAQETVEETRRLKALAQRVGKEGIDLIMDFLQQLYNYLLGEDGYFRGHHAPWLDDSDVEFVFGVPAAWSVSEQQAMVEAAKKVGFTCLSRGSEPEAMAASYLAQHETSLEVGRERD
jgi:hypothetical protein